MKKIFAIPCFLSFLVVLTSCMDLQKAVTSGSLADVEAAIAKGEDVNKKDSLGNTPLIAAARYGDFGIVLALLKKGADPKAKNAEGNDALLALSNYSMPGPSATPKGEKSAKPVGITLEGHLKVAGYLIEQGADANVKNNDGSTPLILASQLNKKELVELLLAKGADANLSNKRGQTALLVAALHGQTEVLCPLLRKGALLEAKDAEGNTALRYAEKLGQTETAKQLQTPCPVVHGASAKESTDSTLKSTDKKTEKDKLLEKQIDALRDPDSSVRSEAARKLGELKDTRAVVPLINAMKDEHAYVRRRATFSLGSMQDMRATESLVNALDDEDAFVQEYALKALEKISGQRLGSDSKKWREWWNRQIRQD